jgi:preprotein translocase subunit SecF
MFGSLGALLTKGFNLGIDFKGGILMEIRNEPPLAIADLRVKLSGLGVGEVSLQTFDDDRDTLIRVQQPDSATTSAESVINVIKQNLPETTEYRRTEFVGPSVGHDLVKQGIMAVVLSIIVISIYIWFRFEWQFSVGAFAATLHDIIATLGFIALMQLEFNLATIAAILTIVGYSINDTVVIYDRIRVNMRRYKARSTEELCNQSLNETLTRTILTSFTTLLALIALFYFGGAAIHQFIAVMIFGIIMGTFSSLYVATPLLLVMRLRAADVALPENPLENKSS